MAVESKHTKGTNGANGATAAAAAVPALANGTAANPTRRKRASSLMQVAAALPSVESSLEEFIAKANQTLVDVSAWKADGDAARADKEAVEQSRREADSLRWKQAETQMRESEAREASLRRQLDGLQGKLAEAEAKVAVATTTGVQSRDSATLELNARLAKAEERALAAELKQKQLGRDLADAKAAAAAAPARPSGEIAARGEVTGDAADKVRIAETKAAKALAAARAACAGLTVSPADLAAIEDGMSIGSIDLAPRKPSVVPVIGAFLGGLIAMFIFAKVVIKSNAAPAAQPAPVATAPTPSVQAAPVQPAAVQAAPVQPAAVQAAPVQPAAVQAAPVQPAAVQAAPVAPTVTPIETPPAAPVQVTPIAPAQTPAVTATHPTVTPIMPAATSHHAASSSGSRHAAKAAPAGGIADPFAAPAAAKKPAAKKPAAGIVDPF